MFRASRDLHSQINLPSTNKLTSTNCSSRYFFKVGLLTCMAFLSNSNLHVVIIKKIRDLSSDRHSPNLWSSSLNNSPYAEDYKTLTPSPSPKTPKKGEGNKKNSKPPLTPLLPLWEKGLGDEGRSSVAHGQYTLQHLNPDYVVAMAIIQEYH